MTNKRLSLDEVNNDAFIQKLKAGDEKAFSDLFSCIVPNYVHFSQVKIITE